MGWAGPMTWRQWLSWRSWKMRQMRLAKGDTVLDKYPDAEPLTAKEKAAEARMRHQKMLGRPIGG